MNKFDWILKEISVCKSPSFPSYNLPPNTAKLINFHMVIFSNNQRKLGIFHSFGIFNPILPGGVDSAPTLMFFFHHPEMAQAMKLKLSDFKDPCLRHIVQVIPGCYILRWYHGNKITKGTLQNLTQ